MITNDFIKSWLTNALKLSQSCLTKRFVMLKKFVLWYLRPRKSDSAYIEWAKLVARSQIKNSSPPLATLINFIRATRK